MSHATLEQSDILNRAESFLTLLSRLTGREFTYRILRTGHGLFTVDLVEGTSNESSLSLLGYITSLTYTYVDHSTISADSTPALAFHFWWGCPSHPQIVATVWANLDAELPRRI